MKKKQFKVGKYGTLRMDSLKKILEDAETEVIIDYKYSDDYAWDNANNFFEGVKIPRERAIGDLRFASRCFYEHDNILTVTFYGYESWTVKASNNFEFIKK